MFVQSNLEKKEEGVPQIRTEPQSHITFMCNSNHTVGILKILMEPAPDRNNRDQYEFSFKTTNKANYRVSEPQGLLLKSPHILYVHLKGVGSLQDTLKDKFKLTIIDKKKMQTIFTAKLGIIMYLPPHVESPACPGTRKRAPMLTCPRSTPSILPLPSYMKGTLYAHPLSSIP